MTRQRNIMLMGNDGVSSFWPLSGHAFRQRRLSDGRVYGFPVYARKTVFPRRRCTKMLEEVLFVSKRVLAKLHLRLSQTLSAFKPNSVRVLAKLKDRSLISYLPVRLITLVAQG